MDVPELAVGLDRGAADRWRLERRGAREAFEPRDMPLVVALATDGRSLTTGPQLAAAGADLAGLLAPEPLESLAWAAAAGARRAYPDLRSLLADEVEAVCVDLEGPAGLALARAAVHAGLHVLLARPALGDTAELRTLVEGAQNFAAAVTVAFGARAWPSVAPARGMLPGLGALRQVTVVGWPLGREARLELVDLVRRLCGDVLAVCAARGAMPAADLRPGEPVTLALLKASGATVLVAETPAARGIADASLTIVASDGRLMLGSDFLRRQDARGVAAADLRGVADSPAASGSTPLAVALGGLDVTPAATSGSWAAGSRTEPATLGDLLAASRVLELAAASLAEGNWRET